jgi:N4-gp56 family major capsid protein
MANVYETGAIFSGALPAGQRTYYEQLLLENLRVKSILAPFTVMKEDFAGRDTGVINYTEVLDTEPDWTGYTENTLWLPGAHLDSRSVSIDLQIHGDIIKVSEYSELVNYWNNGDLRGLVNGKLGQNMVDYIDILARNAFMLAPYKQFGGAVANRAALTEADTFDIDLVEESRTLMEERNVPGVQGIEDKDIQTLVCVTTPRVINQIRTDKTAGNMKWAEVNMYGRTGRIFNGEVGTWSGVRFIKTNRLWLRNYGATAAQAQLDGATVVGQGAYATSDSVYTPGQSSSTRYITVKGLVPANYFKVGTWITIHKQSLGAKPLESDGTQETRRIEHIDGQKISLDRPLMKPHGDGDYVTYGLDVHTSVFVGGPGVVYAVGERPHVLNLPVIDDMAMIRRFGWRGFIKMQLFRPEMFQVIETAGVKTSLVGS